MKFYKLKSLYSFPYFVKKLNYCFTCCKYSEICCQGSSENKIWKQKRKKTKSEKHFEEKVFNMLSKSTPEYPLIILYSAEYQLLIKKKKQTQLNISIAFAIFLLIQNNWNIFKHLIKFCKHRNLHDCLTWVSAHRAPSQPN